MAALCGKLDEFNPDQEEWPQYVERLEQFFRGKPKRRAIFLSVIGSVPYQLLRSLLAPMKPSEKTFEELVAKLTEHYSPKPPEVMQRFRFNSQVSRESIAAYVAELRRIAQQCRCTKCCVITLFMAENDDSIRRKLLQEKDADLTFTRALSIGITDEDTHERSECWCVHR